MSLICPFFLFSFSLRLIILTMSISNKLRFTIKTTNMVTLKHFNLKPTLESLKWLDIWNRYLYRDITTTHQVWFKAGLQFITNIKTSDMMGYEMGNKFFTYKERKQNRWVSWKCWEEPQLSWSILHYDSSDQIGICHGGSGGSPWDDGVFIGLKRVICSHNYTNVGRIRFQYHDIVSCYQGKIIYHTKNLLERQYLRLPIFCS